jgi:hypothetical protein
VSEGKRAEAVKAGAAETDKYGPLEHCARLAGDHATIARIAALRARNYGRLHDDETWRASSISVALAYHLAFW